MIQVGVIGATGYAGAELVRILAGHPQVKLTILTSRQYGGRQFDAIYPAMAGLQFQIHHPGHGRGGGSGIGALFCR